MLCVNFTWQIVKTRVKRLQGVEGRNVCDQIALWEFHSFNACVITTWRLGLRVARGARNKSLCNMTSTRRMALSSTGASLWRREAGERKKESDTQQGPVLWREREKGGFPDNDSTNQQWWRPWKWSQNKLFYIMATVMTMIFEVKKGVMWWDKAFFRISIGSELKRHHAKFKYVVKWWWWTRDLDNYEQNGWVKWLQRSQWWQ